MKRWLAMMALAGLLVAPAAVRAEVHGGGPADPTKKSAGGRIVERMKFPPLGWKVPQVGREVQRSVLSNGIVVYMLPDRTLPRVQLSLSVRGGTLHEPLDKHGMADLTADLMRTGGTAAYSPEELDRKLEVEAIDLGTSSGEEITRLSLDVLKEKLGPGLDLLAEVALRPRFDPKQLEVLREQVHEGLRRQNDQPSDIVHREFPYLVYGDHPYGRRLQWPAVQGLAREDLQAWHARLFTPDRAFVAVAGDFDPTEMTRELERVFGAWKPNGQDLPAVPAVGGDPPGGVFLVKKELNQSNVIVGHLGVTRNDPDRAALELLNYILGGGSFTSRLTEQVRNRAGLAYSVGSTLDLSSSDRGLFFASFQTRANATRQALDLVLQEIAHIRQEPVKKEELLQAQQALVNRMVFQFDTPNETVQRLAGLEIYGLPRDYYQTYAERVLKVTPQDVQRVANRVLQPASLVMLVVGKPEAFDKPLDDLGTVKVVELQEVQ